MSTRAGVALVVVSGGKKFAFEDIFGRKGHALVSVPSHRIELTSTTIPGSRVDTIIFTSRNAVTAIARAGVKSLSPGAVMAVGPATRDALASINLDAAVSSAASTEGLLADLPRDLTKRTIFWPRGEDADSGFVAELERRGATVIAPVVYRKVPLDFPAGLASDVRAGEFGAFACTSPAAAEWLFENLDAAERRVLARTPAAVLGHATHGALRAHDVADVRLAPDATFASLADTVIAILDSEPGG